MLGSARKSPGDDKGDHKGMGLVLRVQVIKGRGLAAKDRSGTSDPYLVLAVGDSKQATGTMQKTLDPEWNQTLEFPVVSADCATLRVVCWDKDRFKKDYMGEFDVAIEDIFHSGITTPDPTWHRLEGRRSGGKKKKDENVSGEVQLKFTLYDAINTAATPLHVISKLAGLIGDFGEDDDAEEDDLLEQVNSGEQDLDDLPEEDDDDDKDPSDETDGGAHTPGGVADQQQKKRRLQRLRRKRNRKALKSYEFGATSDVAGVLFLEIGRISDLPPEKNMTGTNFDMDPFVVTSLGRKTYRTRVVNHNLNPVFDEKLVFSVQKHELNYSLSFAVVDRDKFTGNDFVGTAAFPLEQIRAAAPEADPETGLYQLPDPDEVVEGERERRRRFRLPMSRSTSSTAVGKISRNSSANNVKTLGLTSETKAAAVAGRPLLASAISELSIADGTRPPLSQMNSSMISTTSNPVDAAEPLHGHEAGLKSYEIPLDLKNKARWEDKHRPVLYIQAKYLPYQALRQQFWRVLLRQYDADDTGKLDKVELVTMLDSLGSTLHNKTIDGFFKRWQDVNGEEELLTIDQAVICLEEQLTKTVQRNKNRLSGLYDHIAKPHSFGANSDDHSPAGGNTPHVTASDSTPHLPPNTAQIPKLEVSELGEDGFPKSLQVTGTESPGEMDLEGDLNDDPESKEEHVVQIHECPICHQPRLARGRRTTDADIITHIATCASSDWRAVNNLVMAGFVTSSQAQRKWYSKVISKVSIMLRCMNIPDPHAYRFFNV
jgi:phosphatidylserine decarboxylase